MTLLLLECSKGDDDVDVDDAHGAELKVVKGSEIFETRASG